MLSASRSDESQESTEGIGGRYNRVCHRAPRPGRLRRVDASNGRICGRCALKRSKGSEILDVAGRKVEVVRRNRRPVDAELDKARRIRSATDDGDVDALAAELRDGWANIDQRLLATGTH